MSACHIMRRALSSQVVGLRSDMLQNLKCSFPILLQLMDI